MIYRQENDGFYNGTEKDEMPGTDDSFMKYEFLCGLVRPHLKPRKKGGMSKY
jgi:hypothetical protein